MRRLLLGGALLLLTLTVAWAQRPLGVPRGNDPLTRGLVAWWRGMPGLLYGRTLYDLMGRNHATLSGNASWQATSAPGQLSSVTFDGTSGFGLATTHGLHTTQVTLAAWGYYAHTDCDWRGFVGKQDGTNYDYGVNMDCDASPSRRIAFAVAGTTAGTNIWVVATEFPAHAWFHLAATYDGATQALYLNGVQTNTRSFSTPISNASPEFRLGQDWSSPWLGAITDVRVYNRALSASEVATLYQQTQLSPQLAAYRQWSQWAVAPPRTAVPPSQFFLLME